MTATDRRRWLAEDGEDTEALWNPAHLRHALGITREYEDSSFVQACERVSRRWEMGDDDHAGAALHARVAATLNARDWSIGVVTEHFVAIAVAVHMSDLREEAARTAPADRIAALRDGGFL